MAYPNPKNMVVFTGRLTKDPEVSTINAGGKQIKKARIYLAVPKAYVKNRNADAPSADFPTIDFVGDATVDFIVNHFTKGKAAIIYCAFRSFKYEKDNKTLYGSGFEGIKMDFAISNGDSNSNGNSGASNTNNNRRNTRQKQQEETVEVNENSYVPIDEDLDEDDLPF